jgi:ribose transport system permease protein
VSDVAAPAAHDGFAERLRRALQPSTFLQRYGVFLVFLLMVLFFSVHPNSRDAFPTWDNWKSMFSLAAPLAVVALGLTIVLVMRDFDLSVGAIIGLGGATAVALMSFEHTGWGLALLCGLAMGAAVGAANGFIIAYLRGPSFVVTLAMQTIVVGIEFAITGQTTIFSGVSQSYQWIGQARPLFDIGAQAWLAAGIAVIVYLLLDHTEVGRYMYAIGGNPEAARLSGIRTRELKLLGFVLVGTAAAFAGIMLTAQGAASSPQQGLPFLLPAYAAAFLGSTMFRPGEFNVAGTIVGVLFLQVIQTGLTMLGLSTSVVNIVQGSILIGAVLVSVVELRRR